MRGLALDGATVANLEALGVKARTADTVLEEAAGGTA